MNEWMRKHVDSVIILTAVFGSFLWMNSSINSLKDDFSHLQNDFNNLRTDVAVMKAVMIMKNVMPAELAKKVIPEQETEL